MSQGKENICKHPWEVHQVLSIINPVHLFFNFHLQVSFWVVREILHAQTLKIRAEVLSHYIKTAKVRKT
jgi:hypothetical protein